MQVLCGAVYVSMVEGGSEYGHRSMMLLGVERMQALSCVMSMLMSMRSAKYVSAGCS